MSSPQRARASESVGWHISSWKRKIFLMITYIQWLSLKKKITLMQNQQSSLMHGFAAVCLWQITGEADSNDGRMSPFYLWEKKFVWLLQEVPTLFQPFSQIFAIFGDDHSWSFIVEYEWFFSWWRSNSWKHSKWHSSKYYSTYIIKLWVFFYSEKIR